MNIKNTEVIILAGGKGTRLQSVVNDVPKPMASINGVPFMALLINYLSKFGFSKFRLSIGYKKEIIQDYFKNSYIGLDISYTTEESALGTGGAIKKAISESDASEFLVLNGDSFIELDYSKVESKIYSNGIFLLEVPNTNRYGSVSIENGLVTEFLEKSSAIGRGLINSGVYVLNRDVLNYMEDDVFSIEQITLPTMAQDKKLNGLKVHGTFIDIGIPEDYARAQDLLKQFQ